MKTYDTKKIIEDYVSYPISFKDIGQKYNLSVVTIGKILHDNSIKIWSKQDLLKRDLLVDYFQYIDNEYKAYFLGLIYADGCIFTKLNGKLLVLTLYNDSKDCIIENFKDAIKATRKIVVDKRNVNSRSLTVINDIFVDHLISLGCCEGKPNRKMPEIPDNLMCHFIRGLIDGDGCITRSRSHYGRNYQFSIVILANLNMIYHIKQYLEKILGVSDHCILSEGPNIYSIRYSSKHDFLTIGNYIYNDAHIWISRKKDKFMEACEYFSC